ncbi:hypothetical protein MMAD_48500 [Mycolicibacterium madagascariense]|uniref:Uncharacterized protein n=1 Tax=Mycolicibacterium madagascariense TaxID=212765 RepID=A0A7I7XN06_9MYCO|nr:hypothetical protein [Mycolicibacterium madagascariense]MCV7010859.1 hypothetical protein [Mycolicibacterium madagascariense]BBZ30555.1 hypothetical protein MMAD_48500 [Mycolicibacterium madagascariense]
MAIGIGDGAVANANRPFSFDVRVAHGPKTPSKTLSQEIMDVVGGLFKGLKPFGGGSADDKAKKKAPVEAAKKDEAAPAPVDGVFNGPCPECDATGVLVDEAAKKEADEEAAKKQEADEAAKKDEAAPAPVDGVSNGPCPECDPTGVLVDEAAKKQEAEDKAAEEAEAKRADEEFEKFGRLLDDLGRQAEANDAADEAPQAMAVRGDAPVTKDGKAGSMEPEAIGPEKTGSQGPHAETTAGDHASESASNAGGEKEADTHSDAGQHSNA